MGDGRRGARRSRLPFPSESRLAPDRGVSRPVAIRGGLTLPARRYSQFTIWAWSRARTWRTCRSLRSARRADCRGSPHPNAYGWWARHGQAADVEGLEDRTTMAELVPARAQGVFHRDSDARLVHAPKDDAAVRSDDDRAGRDGGGHCGGDSQSLRPPRRSLFGGHASPPIVTRRAKAAEGVFAPGRDFSIAAGRRVILWVFTPRVT